MLLREVERGTDGEGFGGCLDDERHGTRFESVSLGCTAC